MDGTLTISGPLSELSQIAADIEARYPSGVSAGVSIATYGGWNVETMTMLLRRLAPRQASLIARIVDGDGFCSSEDLLEEFANEYGQLRGLLGPIARHVTAMTREGIVGESAIAILASEFDHESRNPQRISGIRMPAKLLPVARAGLQSI